MAMQRSPDGRLVYLHCSSIFSGANAHVRKVKKVSQLLEQHKASIKTLTKEFTLPAIAAAAKELLEEQVFQSIHRARLRYPELFQPSEIQEAERAASEAEVVRIEAEAAQEIVLTSDDEGGDECLASEQGEQRAEIGEALEDNADAGDSQQPTSQAHNALSIPKLHPVYLPFKTQHSILVSVQYLLEECCLEFGNTSVPDLMEARQWNEAESIELTKWTRRFLKYAKSLPPSAIKPVSGKSIAEVLFGTNILRHSAVHRLPTSAAGILNMLSAAIIFAEALQDLTRAEIIAEIKAQLQASTEEIVQHQNLLERKLTDQVEDIARRRAELDELERSFIKEMLTTDKKQRIEVGSALESFLVGSRQVSNTCTCNHKVTFDETKVDSEAEENIEKSLIEHEIMPSVGIDKAQAYDQSPLGEEVSHQGEKLETRDQPSCHDSSRGSVEEEPEVLGLAVSTCKSKGQSKGRRKAAASDREITAGEEGPVHVDEAPTSEDASHTEAPDEEPLPEDAFPAEEPVSIEDLMDMEKAGPKAPLEISPTEPIIEGFDGADKNAFNQHDNISHAIDDPFAPNPEPGATPNHSAPAAKVSFLAPSPKASPYAERNKPDIHTIALKILNGSKVLRSIISIESCTRTAILSEARAYCVECAQDNRTFGGNLPRGWDLALVSIEMYGYDMDLLTHKVEDLSSVVRTVEETGIPIFTLRMSES